MLAEQLKNSILQAAIQGKLTDQRKEDGTAQDLYNQIQEEKQKLIKEKKIPKPKTLPEITDDEIPFEIPENWMWVKLGNVSDYGGTKLKVSPDDIDSSTWVLDMEDIEKESGKILLYKTGIHKSIKGDRAVFSKGDILYSKLRPYLKKILIAPEDGVCTTELVPFSCYGGVNHQYIVSVLRSPYVTNIVNAASYGVKMPRVGKDIMENLIIPFPPLAEQKRIADTIQKYLAEIEQLEKDEEALAGLQKAFPGKMKASILQQAIQGKLTDQRKEDGSAQDLYNQIQEEKQKLIKAKKIKKEKPLPEIAADEIPFEIPENWMWVRLGKVVKPEVSKEPNESFTYIDIASINNKLNTIQNAKYLNIEKDKIPSRAKTLAEPGDIVFSKVRPYLRNIAIIPEKGDGVPLIASTGFVVLRAFTGIECRYLFYVSISSYLVNSMTQLMKGDNSPSCKKSDVLNCPIPLPPLAEQKRIVEKLDKLLPLCEA